MTRNSLQKAMLTEQRLEVLRALGDPLRLHADVLDDQLGAGGPHRREQSLHPLSHAPVHLDRLRLASEACGGAFERDHLVPLEQLERGVLGLLQSLPPDLL